MRLFMLLFLFSTLIAGEQQNPRELVTKAFSKNAYEAASAQGALRTMGPEGLRAVSEAFDEKKIASDSPELAKWDEVFDWVGQQRLCRYSRLYWYTDLQQAQEAAKASGKPILSLHLLGKLTDEYSCANSRFFRTTLYADREIANLLREKFVLHWWSQRAVPQMSIDYEDGRRLQGTITGNSVHYVLAADRTVIDAIPGLYGAGAFREVLLDDLAIADKYCQEKPELRGELLKQWHAGCPVKIAAAFDQAARASGVDQSAFKASAPAMADVAMSRAVSKMAVESIPVRSMAPRAGGFRMAERMREDAAWIALALTVDAKLYDLDEQSRTLIRHQIAQAAGKSIDRQPGTRWDEIDDAMLFYKQNLAIDSTRNEWSLHDSIHRWLGFEEGSQTLEALNQRIYRNLFLTPFDDPWMGLDPGRTYTGYDRGGVQDGRERQ